MEQPNKKIFTYADILEMPDDIQYELINGTLYAMAPPSIKHQQISRKIANQLDKAYSCEVLQSVGVKFPEGIQHNDQIIDFVIPDIVVACPEKVKKNEINGAPYLIVEILSNSTSSKDCIIKRELYRKNKVNEYWIIDQYENSLSILTLVDNQYLPSTYTNSSEIIINGKLSLFEI